MELFLKSWWSRTYNRPLKDPLLESYTLHELLYEFYDKSARKKAVELSFEEEADRIEEKQLDDTMAWVEEEERKEREAAEAKKKIEDEKWMLEQMKKELGDDFGEDIDLNLSE